MSQETCCKWIKLKSLSAIYQQMFVQHVYIYKILDESCLSHRLTSTFLAPFQPLNLHLNLCSIQPLTNVSLLCGLCLISLTNVFHCVVEYPAFLSFTVSNQSLFICVSHEMVSFHHATLDTSCHSAVAVQWFMDSVPSLNFLLPSHVCHTRLPSHYSSS